MSECNAFTRKEEFMLVVLSKVIPIICIIGIGFWMQKKRYLSEKVIEGFRKIFINLALPALLFLSFIDIDLKLEYFGFVAIIIVFCLLLCGLGVLVNKIKPIQHPAMPFILTGFSFGTIGIPLYGTVFGVENIGNISIIGVGHELFLWFIYYTIMKLVYTHETLSPEMLKGFIKSPLILSVTLGIGLNVLGFSSYFHSNPILNGFYYTLQNLGNLVTPLVLITIGYGLKFDQKYMKRSFQLTMIRLASGLAVGSLFLLFILYFFNVENLFIYAFITFIILPPPFSLPIFMKQYSEESDADLLNNMVVMSTCASIILFFVFVFIINI